MAYQSKLDLIQTEIAIKKIKDFFQKKLAEALNLTRVSAPLFVRSDSGLNDNLSGVERPVSFDIRQTGVQAEIVHSLAKWKRFALGYYGFAEGTGLYTDMNAIRRDEICDEIHSVYVDQWDWELVIGPQERTRAFLKAIVEKIYGALLAAQKMIGEYYPQIVGTLPEQIVFLDSAEMEAEYPRLTPAQREYEYVKKYGAIFVVGIGGKLGCGQPHDLRAPDYDDWKLNGDIILYNTVLDRAFEISSMGIRVDRDALLEQLHAAGASDRIALPFHRALIGGELPLTVGGGIGQSRLCMFLLQKAHIGEVQNSIWPDEEIAACREKNIFLL